MTAYRTTLPAAFCGFSLFLVSSTLTLWGGLQLDSFTGLDVIGVLQFWSLPHITALSLVFLVVSACVVALPHAHLACSVVVRMAVATTLLYLVGYLLLFFAALKGFSLLFTIASGTLIGVGNAGFYLLWEHAFSALEEDDIMKILLGSAIFLPLVLARTATTRQWTLVGGMILIGLSGFLLVICTRNMAKGQRNTDAAARAPRERSEHRAAYRAALKTFRGPLFCVTSLGLVVALTRSNALICGIDSNAIAFWTTGAIVVAAIVLAIFWFKLGIRFTLTNFYRGAFPFVATALLLLPVLGNAWAGAIGGLVYFVFTAVSSLIMFSGIQLSRRLKVSPLFVFGLFAGGAYLLLDIGTAVGIWQHARNGFGEMNLALIALLSIYVLALAFFGIQNKRLGSAADTSFAAAEAARDDMGVDGDVGSSENEGESASAETTLVAPIVPVVDLAAQRCETLAAQVGFSARELEVCELVARGRDVPYIAQALFISVNTVRYHCKNIYRKADVHNKQELMDLVDGM